MVNIHFSSLFFPVAFINLNIVSILLRTDKWAETELGAKWGDKWEERFFAGIGSRQGETWHVFADGDREIISLSLYLSFSLSLSHSLSNFFLLYARLVEDVGRRALWEWEGPQVWQEYDRGKLGHCSGRRNLL